MKEKTEVQRLEERLKNLFKLDEPFVITLNGEWGVGKTHFWNSFIRTNLSTQLENKEIAYISLFGKDTLSDIESDIIMQVSRTVKIKNVLNNIVGSIGYAGVKVSNVLSLIPESDFKDIVICFDDFERKSDKLDSKDILGLISQFKEQKNCKIIMIYNQEEIEDTKVSDYKDKVIDYELHYKPTVEESFKIVSNRLKVFNDYPLEYLKRKGINNIRVIKRLINALNDFEFILPKIEDHSDIKEELVYSIMRLSILNAKFSSFDIESLVEYVNDKRTSENGETNINNEYEIMLFLLDIEGNYFFPNAILENIYYYIKNSIINSEQLLSIINQKIAIKNRNIISQEIFQINFKYDYDLSYSRKNYASELFSALEKGGDYIVDITSVESFIYYIEELIDITGKENYYKTYAREKFQKYIDHMYEGDDISEFTAFGRKHKVIDFDSFLETYINKKETALRSLKTQTKKEIIEIFNAPRINQSWGDEPDLLASVEKDTYKKYMEESSEFMKETLSFISWTQRFSNGSGFDNVVKIMTEAIFDLKGNPDYEYKINKIIERLKIEDPRI